MEEEKVEVITKDRVLYKNVIAIQSSGVLSLRDRKTSNALLYHARKFNIDDEVYDK